MASNSGHEADKPYTSDDKPYTPDDKPYTPDELLQIITADTGGCTLLPSEDYDQVYPNLYIGEE